MIGFDVFLMPSLGGLNPVFIRAPRIELGVICLLSALVLLLWVRVVSYRMNRSLEQAVKYI